LGTKNFTLRQMLSFYQKKFSLKDIGHVLFALSYFEDADKERMPMMLWKIQWNPMKKAIQTWVKTLTNFQK